MFHYSCSLFFIQVIYVCMIYGPIAAYLVKPSRPDSVHIALVAVSHWQRRGWRLGSFDRPILMCGHLGNIYAGLYYPMIVASITLVFGSILLKETYRPQRSGTKSAA